MNSFNFYENVSDLPRSIGLSLRTILVISPTNHLFSLYTWELNCRQTIWDKYEVTLGMSWRTTWELGEPLSNMMGTHCEHIIKQKYPPFCPPLKVKKIGCLMSACWAFSLATWNFYFSKTVCHHFGLGQQQGHKLYVILNWGYLLCFILVSWESQFQLFFFLQWANLIGPSQKKSWNYGDSQNRSFYGKMSASLVGPPK